MIKAELAGSKSQTRRIIKPQPAVTPIPRLGEPGPCPYGVPGDLLYVRESHSLLESSITGKAAPVWYWADGNPPEGDYTRPRPSIHMHRCSSRLTLRITDIRVERLQDISEEDAQAEGVEPLESDAHQDREEFDHGLCNRCGGLRLYTDCSSGAARFDVDCTKCDTHAKRYRWLWESINGEGSWDLNPYLWVIVHETIKQNVDQVIRDSEATS
jgi:hypothetical protein